MTNNLILRCANDRKWLPINQTSCLFLSMDVASVKTGSNTISNVCLVIDKSGSMAGEKIKNAKLAAQKIVDMLTGQDYLGVIAFDSKVYLVSPHQRITNKSEIKQSIEKLNGKYKTSMYKALKLAFREIKRAKKEFLAVNRIILLSDGKPTDNKNPIDYERLAMDISDFNITITTCGIGDYNEELLTILSETSGGIWYHIKNSDEIENTFRNEIELVKDVAVISPKLYLKLPDGFKIDAIYKVMPDAHQIKNFIQGEEVTIPLSDIMNYETQTYVAKIIVQSKYDNEVVSIEVGEESNLYSEKINVGFTNNQDWWVETNPYPRVSFDTAEITRLTEKGLYDKTIMKEAKYRTRVLEKSTVLKDSAYNDAILKIKSVQERGEILSDEERKEVRAKTRVLKERF